MSDGGWFGGLARLVPLRRIVDARGALLPLEFDALPFVPRRVVVVHEVPAQALRGGHGHRRGRQLLVCIHGAVRVRMVRSRESAAVTLVPGGPGLLLEAGVWAEQSYVGEGAAMVILASEPFDPESYFFEPGGLG